MTAHDLLMLARAKQIFGLAVGEDAGMLKLHYVDEYLCHIDGESAGRVLARFPDNCASVPSLALRKFVKAAFAAYGQGAAEGVMCS